MQGSRKSRTSANIVSRSVKKKKKLGKERSFRSAGPRLLPQLWATVPFFWWSPGLWPSRLDRSVIGLHNERADLLKIHEADRRALVDGHAAEIKARLVTEAKNSSGGNRIRTLMVLLDIFARSNIIPPDFC